MEEDGKVCPAAPFIGKPPGLSSKENTLHNTMGNAHLLRSFIPLRLPWVVHPLASALLPKNPRTDGFLGATGVDDQQRGLGSKGEMTLSAARLPKEACCLITDLELELGGGGLRTYTTHELHEKDCDHCIVVGYFMAVLFTNHS